MVTFMLYIQNPACETNDSNLETQHDSFDDNPGFYLSSIDLVDSICEEETSKKSEGRHSESNHSNIPEKCSVLHFIHKEEEYGRWDHSNDWDANFKVSN